MPFLILLFLVLVLQPLPWPDSPFGWSARGSFWATAVATIIPIIGAFALAIATRKRLGVDPANRERIVQRYTRGRFLHLIGLFVVQIVALALLGWGTTVRDICHAKTADSLPFGAELLVIAPFMIGLVASWAGFYSAEQQLKLSLSPHDRAFGGRLGYVVFLARQYLAVVGIPLGLMIVVRGLQLLNVDWLDGTWVLFAPAVLVVAALILAPWLLRFILGARSLPAGPLRTRLENTARRLKFRYSDILLWDTRGGVVNAMVSGPLPRLRYIFLSDRLVAEFSPEEVEAVFGHEIGHIRHHHLPFYALFLILSVMVLVGLWILAMNWLAASGLLPAADSSWRRWESVPQMLAVAVYVFFAFGFISRRCERQADVYGCRAASCSSANCDGHGDDVVLAANGKSLCSTGIRTFMQALDKVASLNGISRNRPGLLNAWLHGTIGQRIEFLDRVVHDRQIERRFQRRLGWLKWGLLVVLTLSVAIMIAGNWSEIHAIF